MIRARLLRIYAVGIAFSVAASFIIGSMVYPQLEDRTGLTVAPGFSGGRELFRFRDDYGDDTGEGTYSYPDHPNFNEPGLLDLLYYTVYEPQIYPPWQNLDPYWQLGITLADLPRQPGTAAGFRGPVIRIFLDVHGPGSGQHNLRGTGLSASPDAPWDWMIQIDESRNTALLLLPADSSWEEYRIPLLVIPDRRSLYVRIPLDLPQTEVLLGGARVHHYVVSGVYDPYAEESFQAIGRHATRSSGGGASSRSSSRVYDILMPPGEDGQADLVAARSSMPPLQTILPPRTAFGPGGLPTPRLEPDAKRIDPEPLAAELAEYREESRASLQQELSSGRLHGIDHAIALFHLGRHEQARTAFRQLHSDPDTSRGDRAIAQGFLGCLLAIDGGAAASPSEAIRLVQRGMDELDAAIDALGDTEYLDARITLLVARASVAASVPESVFELSAAAASDYETAVELVSEQSGEQQQQGDWLVQAALAWEQAGERDRADLAWIRAAGYREDSPLAAWETARRGY